MENKDLKDKNELIGQAMALSDSIDYQAGSVVSRAVIDKTVGTVTLFAFDEGQGLSEHTAPYDALVYVFDGEAEIVISGNPTRVKKGEVIVMPANEPHALKAITKFKKALDSRKGRE